MFPLHLTLVKSNGHRPYCLSFLLPTASQVFNIPYVDTFDSVGNIVLFVDSSLHLNHAAPNIFPIIFQGKEAKGCK